MSEGLELELVLELVTTAGLNPGCVRNMRGNGEDLGGVHSSRYGHNYRHDRVIGLYICIYIYTYIYIYI